MAEKEKYIGSSKMKENAKKNFKFKMKPIQWNQLSKEVQNSIVSIEKGGIALSTEWGDSELIGITQKKLSEEHEDVAKQFEEIEEKIENMDVDVDLSGYYTKAEVDQIIATLRQGQYVAVDELPTPGVDTMFSIYLIPRDEEEEEEDNVRDEYITVLGDNSAYRWEKIGSTKIDLSGVQETIEDLDEIRAGAKKGATAQQPETTLAGYGIENAYTKTEVDSLIKGIEDEATADYGTISKALASKANTSDLATVATTGEYSDLKDTPTIPSKVSDLENDANYVTEEGFEEHTGNEHIHVTQADKDNWNSMPTSGTVAGKADKVSGSHTDEIAILTEGGNLAASGKKLENLLDAEFLNELAEVALTGSYNNLSDVPDLSSYIDSGMYDSTTKKILLKHGNDTVVTIDATDFIKDGMVSEVKIEDENLIITFNSDAGKEDISIAISKIFDANKYYTKSIIDDKLDEKQNTIDDLEAIIQNAEDGEEAFGWGNHAEAGYLTSHQDISGKADRMKIVEASGNTLTAAVGNYYRFDSSVSSLTITLTEPSDSTYLQSLIISLTTGSSVSLSFTNTDIAYFDGYSIEANTSYELNIVWNGKKWIVAYGIIA